MQIAETLHVKVVERFQLHAMLLGRGGAQDDLRAPGVARSRAIVHAPVDRRHRLDLSVGRGMAGCAELMPSRSVRGFVHVKVGAVVREVDRRPEPEELRTAWVRHAGWL